MIVAGVTTTLVCLSLVSPLAALSSLLILSPLRTLIATESQFQLPLDIGQLGLILFLAFLFMWSVTNGKRLLQDFRNPVTDSLLLFLLVSAVSVLYAPSLTNWLTEWLKWLQVLIIVTLVVSLTKNGHKWEWLIFILIAAGVANAFVGAYEFFGGSGALHLLINDRFFRAFGTFGQPNPFGGFMGMIIPLGFGGFAASVHCLKFASPGKRNLRIGLTAFYLFSTLIMLAGIVMSWSRGAWIGLIGASLVAFFMFPRNRRFGLLSFAAILLTLTIVWVSGLVPASVTERLGTATEELFAFEDIRGTDITPANFAVTERLAHWQAAINMATASPLWGVGLGNYEIVYPQYRLLNWAEPLGHAHNYYLNLVAEVGVIGLLGYGKVILSIIALSWRTSRHPDNMARYMVIAILSSWVYICIHSLFDNLFVNNIFLHIGVMSGILVTLHKQSNSGLRISE